MVMGGIFTMGAVFGYSNRLEVEKVTSIFNKEISKPNQIDFSPFWTTWNTINSKFVANGDVDNQARVWGAIEGLVKSLEDPYSVFFPPQESKMFEENINGEFGGVGMEIGMRKEVLTVVAPLKDTPAFRAGIKAGDKIVKIDEEITVDMTVDQAAQLIRGEKGTPVVLIIIREDVNEPLEIEIIRDVIVIPVLDTESKPGGVFVISMYNFSGNSINTFREALREFITSGDDKLILDLRGNPGGFLDASIDIASWFLPVGEVVAREKFADGQETIYRSRGYDIFEDLSMVVLIDGGSASASEILAGALKEHGIAKLVGRKTFGKGSVQELIQITSETSLKLTIAKWLTPEGVSFSENGLEPDYDVEITIEDFEEGRDPQLEKALELLSNEN